MPARAAPLLLVLSSWILAVPQPAQERVEPFRGDPKALRLYRDMNAALRSAGTLHLVSDYAWYGAGAEEIGRCRYEMWLAKPNRFRIETRRSDGKPGGVLVGDGRDAWIHWPSGRPFFSTEDPKEYARTRTDQQYYRVAAPPRRHSIGHLVGLLGAGMSMTIVDPSTFHGYTDSLQPHLDGVRMLGRGCTDDGEECDIVLVSFMKGQRTWQLWLARTDHLPRRMVGTVHVRYDIVTTERWSAIELDSAIDPARFAWQPPEHFTRWFKPDHTARLLRPGTPAPDFELRLASGGTRRLSALRGKVVWLNFWRVG